MLVNKTLMTVAGRYQKLGACIPDNRFLPIVVIARLHRGGGISIPGC